MTKKQKIDNKLGKIGVRDAASKKPPQIYESPKANDVRRVGYNLLKWYTMPQAVDDDEIEERLYQYIVETLDAGELLTVETMCLAMGYDHKTVREWILGRGCSARRSKLVQKAMSILSSFESQLVTEGKINTTAYIFRAKNYFGMRDQVDHVVQAANPLGQLSSPDEIRERLAASVEAEEQKLLDK